MPLCGCLFYSWEAYSEFGLQIVRWCFCVCQVVLPNGSIAAFSIQMHVGSQHYSVRRCKQTSSHRYNLCLSRGEAVQEKKPHRTCFVATISYLFCYCQDTKLFWSNLYCAWHWWNQVRKEMTFSGKRMSLTAPWSWGPLEQCSKADVFQAVTKLSVSFDSLINDSRFLPSPRKLHILLPRREESGFWKRLGKLDNICADCFSYCCGSVVSRSITAMVLFLLQHFAGVCGQLTGHLTTWWCSRVKLFLCKTNPCVKMCASVEL